MPATILDGKAMAKAIRQDVARDVARLREVGLTPGLAVVLVGDDPASHTYVRAKAKACREVASIRRCCTCRPTPRRRRCSIRSAG